MRFDSGIFFLFARKADYAYIQTVSIQFILAIFHFGEVGSFQVVERFPE